MDACGLKASCRRNATLDGAYLNINQVGIHRPYDSLSNKKAGIGWHAIPVATTRPA